MYSNTELYTIEEETDFNHSEEETDFNNGDDTPGTCNNNLYYGFDNPRIHHDIVAEVPPEYATKAPNLLVLHIRNTKPFPDYFHPAVIDPLYDREAVLFDTPIAAIRLDKKPSCLVRNPVHALVLTKSFDTDGAFNLNIYNVTDREMVLMNHPVGADISLNQNITMMYTSDYDVEISRPGQFSLNVQLPLSS